jgi:TetR/AcrR family transcriptional regulator
VTTPLPATRSAILDAAEELFAVQGFKATTIKQIGTRAGVNTALLYYYFPDKLGLYRAVLARLGEALAGRVGPSVRQATTPAGALRGLVRGQTELLVRHPRAAALLIRELLDHEASNADPTIRVLASTVFNPLISALDRGKDAGSVRRNLNPEFAAISTISQLVYFTLARPLIRVLLEQDDDYPTEADVRAFGRHAEAFAEAAVVERET